MNDVNDILSLPNFASFVERFHRQYTRYGLDECWPWHSRRNGHTRYGAMRVGVRGKTMKFLAHRVAWVLVNGQIPVQADKLYVLHKCDNPECVNPKHLFLGTHLDNMVDKCAKGRQPRGEKVGRAKLTEQQVVAIRADRRAYTAIAAEYGMSSSVVGDIVRGYLWAHVPGAREEQRWCGVSHPEAKLYPEAVRDIRTRRLDGPGFAELYGVDRTTIYQVWHRKTWCHVL